MNVDSILISDLAQVISGKLTVLGVFNRIGPAKLPVVMSTMAVSVVMHAHHDEAGSEHQAELRLIDQDRNVINTHPTKIQFARENLIPGIPLRAVKVIVILTPSFERAGAYAYEFYIDDTYHAAASFVVLGE